MSTFTDLFIRRPVLAIVISLVIVIAGLQAVKSLVVRQYPESENAAIKVTTAYVGADAELVRGFLTAPLERAIAGAAGIDYLESQSVAGLSTITVRLNLNQDGIKALAEVSSKVDQVRGDLPPSAEVPIINLEPADSQFASAYLSFSSEELEQNQITDYLVRVVQPRLSALDGVQRAEILGGRTFAMRLWLKPDRLAALGITPTQVSEALARNNHLAAVGRTKSQLLQVDLTANTDLHTVEEFRRLVIKEEGGILVRLEDVADVALGAENYDTDVRFSGKTAVFLGVWVLPNANSIDVIKDVDAQLADLRSELPSGLTAALAYDATTYIQDALSEVTRTLLETLLIVVLVILLFLGSFRSALVPLVAIPVSLIGAVFVMQVIGFTVNLLTLLAIVLSVGLVVDDAVVVVENVERRRREGASALDAAVLGARELALPILAMTITLAAVYAPIGLQGGLTGSLFREFAFTLAGAVVISGIVALTLSPLMASRLVDPRAAERGFGRLVTRTFERVRTTYARALDATLGARPAVYATWLLLSALCIPLFLLSPRELAPTEDQGIVFGIVEGPPDATLDQLMPSVERAKDAMFASPETAFTFQITNPSGGFGGAVLAPWGERQRTTFEVMPEIAARLNSIAGIRMFTVMPRPSPAAGTSPSRSFSLRSKSRSGWSNSPSSSATRPPRADSSPSRRSSIRRSTSRAPRSSSTARRSPPWA